MFGAFPLGRVPYGAQRYRTFARISGTGEIITSFARTLCIADHDLIFPATDDTWPNTSFVGDLDFALNNFRRSILGSDVIGEFTTGLGELEIINTDGTYDALPENYSIDGQVLEIRYGQLGTLSYGQWLVLFKGTATDLFVDDQLLRIQLEDFGRRIAVPLQSHVYAGTGDLEGTADLTGKRRPRAFGWVYEIEPPLVIPNYFLFQVNEGPVAQISAVYDNGVPLAFSGNYNTVNALIAANVPPGKFASCIEEGYFRIAFDITPDGAVTADVKGDALPVFAEKTGDVVRRILALETDLVDADIDLASIAALNTAQPAPVGFWASHDDQSTVADVISTLMRGIGGWGGFKRDGTFELRRFVLPSGTPVERFDRTNIVDGTMQRERMPAGVRPPPWRWRIGYRRIETLNSTPAGSVDADRRSYLAAQYRVAEASSDLILTVHKLAQDRPVLEAHYRDFADAQAEADRLLQLYGSERSLYRFSVGPIGYLVSLGDVIQVTYPRWNLTGGRLLTVVEMTENSKQNTVEIVGFG